MLSSKNYSKYHTTIFYDFEFMKTLKKVEKRKLKNSKKCVNCEHNKNGYCKLNEQWCTAVNEECSI